MDVAIKDGRKYSRRHYLVLQLHAAPKHSKFNEAATPSHSIEADASSLLGADRIKWKVQVDSQALHQMVQSPRLLQGARPGKGYCDQKHRFPKLMLMQSVSCYSLVTATVD